MITVTFGTTPFPFDRAVSWLNALLQREVIVEPMFIQYGVTDISSLLRFPKITGESVLETSKLMEKVENSRLVISHAGQGSTRALAARGISFVLLPRLSKFKEHMDDHQLWFAQSIELLGVKHCVSLEELESSVTSPPSPLCSNLFDGPKLVDHLTLRYSSTESKQH